jgi:hypothetical protein
VKRGPGNREEASCDRVWFLHLTRGAFERLVGKTVAFRATQLVDSSPATGGLIPLFFSKQGWSSAPSLISH